MGHQYLHSFLLISIIIVASSPYPSSSLSTEFLNIGNPDEVPEERIPKLFQAWKEKHGKVYEHVGEEAKRMRIFRANLEYVVEKNKSRRLPMGYVVGLNEFADLSNEELGEIYTSKIKKPFGKMRRYTMENIQLNINISSCVAPSSVDWRDLGAVTPVL